VALVNFIIVQTLVMLAWSFTFRHFACCWWKGFQNGIFVLLWGVWGLWFNWQSESYHSTQVHVDEQDHAKQVCI